MQSTQRIILARRRRARRRRDILLLVSVSILVLTVLAIGMNSSLHHTLEVIPGLMVNGETRDGAAQAARDIEKARTTLIAQAGVLAESYDYDTAIDLLKSWDDFEEDEQIVEQIAGYEETKTTLVAVDPLEVTHIFYHSLIVEPERAFANPENAGSLVGMNQWLTTMDEFNKITQEMYDRDYVLVSLHDLIEESVDENGVAIFAPGTIMLPPGKKAFVMSIDDVNYYHNYANYTTASKLVLDDEGRITNEYIQEDGTVVYGSYDVVPLLDDFIEKHPDASYRGAKGMLALTGYNGLFGYRTDETYDINHPELDGEQRVFLENNPDFDREADIAQARAVAEALTETGWDFADHTWGHMNIWEVSLGHIADDTQRWERNVEPIIGKTNVLIFPHGADFQMAGPYDKSDPKFAHFYERGYRIFCGVSATAHTVFFGDDYLRMHRRNLDGYTIYYNSIGAADSTSDLFDAQEILDPARPPVAPL